jgi:transposase-like protein
MLTVSLFRPGFNWKIVRNRGYFPSDEVASKLLYVALGNIERARKTRPIIWKQAANLLAILFDDRFTNSIV